MTEFYEGTPGSGKSLFSAKTIDDLLRRTEQYIVANFDIDLRIVSAKSRKNDLEHIRSHFVCVEDARLTPDILLDHCAKNHRFETITINDVEQLHCPEHQTLLIIDEAEILFNCRGWNNKNRAEWCKFFSLHRHYGFDCVLIAPSASFVDKQILAVIENRVTFMNLKNWNFMGRVCARLSGGSMFVAKHYWHGAKECVSTDVFRYNKRLGSLYNTSAVFLGDRKACGSAAGQPIPRKEQEVTINDALPQ